MNKYTCVTVQSSPLVIEANGYDVSKRGLLDFWKFNENNEPYTTHLVSLHNLIYIICNEGNGDSQLLPNESGELVPGATVTSASETFSRLRAALRLILIAAI